MKPLPSLAMGGTGLSVWSLPLPARPLACVSISRAGLVGAGALPLVYVRCCWPSYCSAVGHGIKALRGRLRRGSFRAPGALAWIRPLRPFGRLRGLDTAPLSLRCAPLGAPTRAQRAAHPTFRGWVLCRRGVLRFRRCVVCGGVRPVRSGSVAWSGICSQLGRRRGARAFPLVGACFGPSSGLGFALW